MAGSAWLPYASTYITHFRRDVQGFERASGIGVGNDIIIHCIARPSWVLGSGGLCMVAIWTDSSE